MNFKFRIKDEEQSRQLQKILFELGYGWKMGEVKEVNWTKKPFLYALSDRGLMYLAYGINNSTFTEHYAEEIEL